MTDRRARRTRERVGPKGRSLVGQSFEAEVGPIAHGGHCVARIDNQVVFVRHALPGERVLITITEGGDQDRFLRGDATSVLDASPDRVEAPCRYAGPGLCGGCDFQHVGLEAQRRLKASVVEEQLRRLAKLDRHVEVEAVPLPDGDLSGLHWRTRVQWAHDAQGRRGLRQHRSHQVIPIEDCLLLSPDVRDAAVGGVVVETVEGHDFEVDGAGFWQVHPSAPRVLVDAVLGGARLGAGDRVVDLYAGVGLFSAFIAEAVGDTGAVMAVEGDEAAAAHAWDNLAAYPWVEVVTADVGQFGLPDCEVVVLDPPREGAKRRVVEAIVEARPRTVVYVACDPAAMARDVAFFGEAGYDLSSLRAFDLFPMTHHVECVAVLTRSVR